MADKVIIKKYSNRRLYDTEKNAYVTLQQVTLLIKEGRQVEVVDAKSNEDVTSYILTQILLEEARKKNVLLPVPLLHLLIRYGETLLSEFFEKYLHQIIRNYLVYKSSMDEHFEKWLDLGMNLTGSARKTLADLVPFQSLLDVYKTPPQENQPSGDMKIDQSASGKTKRRKKGRLQTGASPSNRL
jgi:polyhydroxyalkanoate synthesis repressor PhaR